MCPFAVDYMLLMSVCLSLLETLGGVAWHGVVLVNEEDAAHPAESALESAST